MGKNEMWRQFEEAYWYENVVKLNKSSEKFLNDEMMNEQVELLKVYFEELEV